MLSQQQQRLFESVENELITEILDLSGGREHLARGLPRRAYLDRLHQLKRRRVFPFLKLAPEMRNLIYPYLLKHNRKEGCVAHPAILRTCKQLYKETSPMLKHESLAQLSIRFTGQEDTGRLDYFASGRYASARLEYTSHIKSILTDMRHVQHLAINIGCLVSWQDERVVQKAGKHLTRFFACVFEVCTSLKSLELVLPEQWNEDLIRFTAFTYMGDAMDELEKRPDSCDLKVEGLRRETVEHLMEMMEIYKIMGEVGVLS